MRKQWVLAAAGAVLAVHLAWLCSHVVPAYASPDADGYFAQAERLAEHGDLTFRAESPVEYLPIHWLELPDGRFISRYPPGLPVLLAGAWRLFGRTAAFYVNPLLATLTLLFVFLLCRPWVGDRLALVAMIVFAVNPLANVHALHSDAHTASTFFLVSGLWALDGWLRQGGWGRAALAGLLLGATPAMRYAEAAAALGVAVMVLANWKRLAGHRNQILALAAAAALPLGLLLAYNQLHFGAFWKTGYALTNEQQIRWAFFRRDWHAYLEGLLGSGIGPFFALGVAGLAALLTRRETRALALGLGLVIAAISAVYAGYYFNRGPGGASMRFLLPTLPLYLLPALWLLARLDSALIRNVAVGAVLAVTLLLSIPLSARQVAGEFVLTQRAAALLGWIEEDIPAGSVIVADHGIHEEIHFTGRWKLADVTVVVGAGPRGGRRELMASLFGGADTPRPMQPGKGEKLRARYRGLSPEETARRALEDLAVWARTGSGEIYWVGDRAQVERFAHQTGGAAAFELAGRIELPGVEMGMLAGVAPGAVGERAPWRARPRARGPGAGPGFPAGPPPEEAPWSPPAAMPGRGFPRTRALPGKGVAIPGGGPPRAVIEVYRLKYERPSQASQAPNPTSTAPRARTIAR